MKKFFPSLVGCINLLLLFFILWKGGKALDAVWMLAIGTSILVFFSSWNIIKSKEPMRCSRLQWSAIIATLAFLFWTILSFIFSKTQNYGFDEVLQTASYALLFISLILHPSLPSSLQKKLPRTIAIALLLACGVGVFLYLTQPLTRFVGSFFDYRFHTDYWPNAFAEFFLLAWPCALYAVYKIEQKLCSKKDILRLIVLGFLCGCFFLTYSRGAFLSFVVQVCIGGGMMFILEKPSPETMQKRLRDGVLILCIALGFFFSINAVRSQHFVIESVLKKAQFESQEGKSSIDERSQFFSQAITLTKEHPLLGWGPYSFRFVQPRLQEGILATSDHPHNVLLKLAMERGIPSVMFFLMILILCTTALVQKMIDTKTSDEEKKMMIIFFVSGIGVLAHNMIDFNLQFIGITLPIVLMMACVMSSESSEKKYDGKYASIIMIILSIILGGFTVIEGYFLTMSSIARHQEKINRDLAVLYYEKSQRLSFFDGRLQLSSLFSRDALLSEGNLVRERGDYYGIQEPLEEYKKKNTEDYRLWKMMGYVNSIHEQRDEALSNYATSYQLGGKWNDPEVASLYVQLLSSFLTKEEFLKKYRFEFDSLLNDYAYAILQNSHFIALGDNVENTIKLAETLKRIVYPPYMVGPFDGKNPDDDGVYDLLIEQIKEHAAKERAHLTSRERGVR